MYAAEGFRLVASNPIIDGAGVLSRTTIDGVDPGHLSRIDPGMNYGKDGLNNDALRVPQNASIAIGPSPLAETLPDYSNLTKELAMVKLALSDD